MASHEIIRPCLEKHGYIIEKQLGVGGFGITYLVKNKKNPEVLYVIKTVKDEHLRECLKYDDNSQLTEALESLENEAKKLRELNEHTHIVKIHELLKVDFETLKLLFLLMEYIEGEDLKQLVHRRESPLEEIEALDYISQIGNALIALHNKNVVHRDIKPRNIMVRKATNKAVLIDFGIARTFRPDIIATYTRCGSPKFMPPEQFTTKTELGSYTDIYSLAATLYYLLTNKNPTSARDREMGDSLEQAQDINHTISDRVNEAILWGLEMDFKKRPQRVKEWLELLNPDKIKFNYEDLIKSPDFFKKAIISHYSPNELDTFLVGFDIDYEDLDGKYLHEKVEALTLIEQMQGEDNIKTFVNEMKYDKPEAFINKQKK
ncbi:MAG: serine/threonine-protein kinase [Cyanobacteria bacterium P01_A01_bin.83]